MSESRKEWNTRRYNEIREEVKKIKAKETVGKSKPIEQLLAEVKIPKRKNSTNKKKK